ncbi:MAG: hypothetical protein J6J86_04240 [Lachnospiraceae bacterium]|nr:hypothetical protein [Lachnospiraceae bacterium]
MEKLFIEVLNMSVQAGIVVCFILLARWVFHMCHVPKKYAYVLWAIPFVRLVCPVSLQSAFSLLPKEAEGFHENTVNWLEQTAKTQGTLGTAPVLNQIDISPLAPTPQYSAEPLQIWTGICSYIWVLAVGMLIVYSLCRLLMLRRRLRLSICLRENIYLTDEIDTPFVIGLVKPRIYLPSDLSEQELAYVILHEQMHIRRCDMLVKMTAYLITLLHWFNPLAWVAFLCMGKDMEMSCDEAVVRQLGVEKEAEYAETLLKLSVGKHRLQGIALAFGEGNTRDRVKNIMKYKKPLMITGVFAVLVIGALVIGLLTDPKSETGVKETTVTAEQESGQAEHGTQGQETETASVAVKPETRQSAVLSYMAEGMPVEEPAVVFAGDGYTILIPSEGWEQTGEESWTSSVNDMVGIQISHYDTEGIPTAEELSAQGYEAVGDAALPLHMSRSQAGIREHVIHWTNGTDTWRIDYYYPDSTECEEGFGTLLRAIVKTFTPDEKETGVVADSVDTQGIPVEITTPQVSPDMLIGVQGTLLDYADEDIIIFHDYYGLFVFSTDTGGMKTLGESEIPYGIVRSVDLASIGCGDTQGSNCCDVKVSPDGSVVYLHPMEKDDMYVYDVAEHTLTKQKYSYEGLEFFDSYAEPDKLYELGACSYKGIVYKGQNGNPDYYGYLTSYDYTLGNLCYVEHDMVFQIFETTAVEVPARE